MSIPAPENPLKTRPTKPKRDWVAHDDFYDGDFLRGWLFAVHRVHTAALGYSLLPENKSGVKGYKRLFNEKSFSLSSRSLIFNTPLASNDWDAALKTELRAIQISRASRGKDGYAQVALYSLNDTKTGLKNERILETTQSAVIAYLRHGTEFPPSENGNEPV
ncbi:MULTISPECIES: hypothetical protein [Pseudomonas]|uniref:Uncharacterized protein n=1 Tax=Pseudomonas cichorii TaxID=36746 RepID=A0ABQ1DNF1_PSECI|nr:MULTISPECIES: hypothetical protein [Pseudomonas]QVE17802.1 hypothetical protein KGD89_03200 [Pseudomonas cichorii]GFM78559.1 hypothetical protein PSCICM_43780 [Pseudomonas cichorii]GFM92508.1 hypothetical protein PSCICP_24800 [Pseudomonas cichorii]SDN86679.1 hypothetical protein SAMN05216599_10412 [Pseudomonas cichorii]